MPQLIKPPVSLFEVLYLVEVDISGLAQIIDYRGVGVTYLAGMQNILFVRASKSVLVSNQLPMQLVPGVLYPEGEI